MTITLADRFGVTPWAIMREDCGQVIATINHFLEMADKKENELPKGNTIKTTVKDDGFWNF